MKPMETINKLKKIFVNLKLNSCVSQSIGVENKL